MYTHTYTTFLQLSGFCPWQPGWAGTTRNIHPLTPIVVVNHPLSASSIYYDSWHPFCSIYMPDSLFPQSLSKFSLVYLLAWNCPLHTPYISSPSHCLLDGTNGLSSSKPCAHCRIVWSELKPEVVYKAHRMVIFAIAQLSCFTIPLHKSNIYWVIISSVACRCVLCICYLVMGNCGFLYTSFTCSARCMYNLTRQDKYLL